MALRDLTFIKYLEAAFRHKLFKDPNATFFNYLGFNLKYKSEAGKKGIFEYARRVLPLAYTNEFADTDEGNLQMARAVIERLDREGKPLDLFIQPQIPKDYDLVVSDARVQSEQAQAVQAEPGAAGGEAPGTMLGGIPSAGVPQVQGRIIRSAPQTKPPVETPLEKRVPGLKTTLETGLDYEGKPIAVPSALKSAGKNLATDAQIGIKKGITRAGTNFSSMLGGVGRGAGGILGGIGSGGVRLVGGVGGTLSNIGTQMTRNPLIKFSGRRALVILLLLLIPLVFLTAFAPAPSPGTQPTPGQPAGQGAILDYTIPFRDSSVSVTNPDDIKNQVRSIWPNAQLQNWDTIVDQAITNGWNPAFVLTLWIEETGAQGVPSYLDPLGCAPGQPTTDINLSLRCLFNNFPISKYPNDKFADFMCMYSESKLSPCSFITNRFFPKNIKDWYSKLVPSGLGALVAVSAPTPAPPLVPPPPGPEAPSSPLGFSITCPLASGPTSGFRIICGTATNPRSGCGHGVTGYPTRCNPTVYVCDTTSTQYSDGTYALYSPALYNAVDVRPASGNGSGSPVYLPFLDGNQSVNWTRVDGPTSLKGGEWGVKVVYEADYNGKKLRLDLTHLNQGVDLNSPLRSGHQVGILKPGLDRDGGGHLHTSMAVDGVWKDGISESYLCSNRPS